MAGGATFDAGTGTVVFNGAGGADASHDFNNLTVNKSGGTLTISAGIDVSNGTLTLVSKNVTGVTTFSVTGGNLNLGSSSVTCSSDMTVTAAGILTDGAAPGTITIYGHWYVIGGGIFNGTGTVVFTNIT
ncbi:hypothetical protein ES703_38777 [subsurface metagenome]